VAKKLAHQTKKRGENAPEAPSTASLSKVDEFGLLTRSLHATTAKSVNSKTTVKPFLRVSGSAMRQSMLWPGPPVTAEAAQLG
jgi:hypothetical protein